MQSPTSQLPSESAGEGAADFPRTTTTGDHELVVSLQDPHMRALCACADGLSHQALLRLEAAAELLRQTEGLDSVARTAQL